MATSRTRSISLVLALTACSGAQSVSQSPSSTQTAPLPMIDGAAVFPRPIDSADAEVQAFWQAAQDQLQNHAPSLAAEMDEGAYQAAVHDAVMPWMRARGDGLRTLVTLARPLVDRRVPEARVLVGATFGFVVEDFLAQTASLPLPAGIARDPELSRAFRERMEELTTNVAQIGHDGYAACARDGEQAPAVLSATVSRCAARAHAMGEQLAAIRAREETHANAETDNDAPAIPPECEGGDHASPPRDWDGPAPDEHAPREVAVLYDGDTFTGAALEQVMTAVTARLRRQHGLVLVPRAEVREAERLESERRIAPGGPVCGMGWPATALLARRHPNLMAARVNTFCEQGARDEVAGSSRPAPGLCTLSVTFARVGTDDDAGVPPALTAPVHGQPDVARTWVRAAAGLNAVPRPHEAGIFAMLAAGGNGPPIEYRLLEYSDDEPALRIGNVMTDPLGESHLRAHFAECITTNGTGSYALRWTVSPTGAVTAASAEPITRTRDADSVARCIAEHLREVQFPCTPSGSPVNVEARMCLGR